MVKTPLADNHRPMIQWVWDTDPTPELVRRQLQAVRDAEFAGVVIQPMPAEFRPHDFPQHMSIPYLGPAFFEAFGDAVRQAAELGLVVWIYDEGGWPSGSACGQVLRGHEHLRGKMMIHESGRCIVVPSDRPDPLRLEAIQRFIALTHEGYARAVGEHLGATIRAIFTDELTVPGCVGTDRIPWTDDLPQEFARRLGYDLTPALPLLFEGSAAGLADPQRVLQVRHDFSRLCVDLFVERCLAPQRQWCDEHGLQFVGHFAGEHDLMRHPHNVGDFMAAARQLHAPGVDTIWRQIWPDHRADFARFAGSLRLLHGQDAFSETGAVYGVDLSPAQWKWVCDQQMLRGINRFSLMSLRLSGATNEGLSPLDLQDPSWPAMRHVNRHIGLLASLCSAGRPRVEHAVLYPSDDLYACGSDGAGMAAQGIMEHLQARAIEAVYVDERALGDGAMSRLGVRDLYLPGGAVMRAALVLRLRQMELAGLRLHVVGRIPLHVLEGGEAPWSPSPLPSGRDPVACVLPLTNGPLSLTVRHGEGWEAVVLFNESDQDQQVRLLDPAAEVYRVDEVPVRLAADGHRVSIAPGEVLLVQRGRGPVQAPLPTRHDRRELVDLPLQNWRMQPIYRMEISPDNRWRQTPEHAAATDAGPGPWSASLGEAFSGQARYEATFRLDQPIDSLTLDLGVVQHVAVAKVDGREIGCRAFAPYRLDWSGRLDAGVHRLELLVSNSSAGAFWLAPRSTPRRETVYVQRIRERCFVQFGGGLLGPVRLRGGPLLPGDSKKG